MKKFGLALSGGGARAIIHAGFLQALNESGLHPEIISGASMGAIIGALYADGFPPDEMLKVLIKPEISRLPAWIGRKGGIGSLMVLREHLDGILQAKSF
ncbi:MAG TPA: patatin-like phospholipase family protein, partial [Bacteroidales bacterium]|nr:patatin-like phospholipase family protein [Bacteroidales bacterium]